MLITIVGPNLNDQRRGQFHVHRAGCADLKSREYRGVIEVYSGTIEAKRALDAVAYIYGPDAGGFYEESGGDETWGNLDNMLSNYSLEFHFAPCVKDLEVKARPTIEFDDSDFVAAHGRKPRGEGQWAFRVAGEVWWQHGMFAYAKMKIRQRIMAPSTGIHDLGHIKVEVLG